VPQDSANIPGYVQISIHANHEGKCKFENGDDPGFLAVVGELRRWTSDLGRRSRGDQAERSVDAAITNNQSVQCLKLWFWEVRKLISCINRVVPDYYGNVNLHRALYYSIPLNKNRRFVGRTAGGGTSNIGEETLDRSRV
jgi:hypothetical protein